MRCNTDLETWLHDFEDRVYRILEYRKPYEYTPYEMENKFIDESIYRDTHYKMVFIEEVIELPDKDILIGFNPRFLMDALRVIDDEEITMYLVNPKAPFIIKNDEQSYIYLVLPISFNM